MIRASADFAALAASLAEKARMVAEAHLAARRAGPLRWRSARRLWPLFTKG
jgi:hypothetical protein